MSIKSELAYMYGLTRFGIQPGLAVMEHMMRALGNPERKFKSIHVTGTNGKGSTCAMIESIVRQAGYKTALYTSPHLYSFHERIQINRVAILDEDLAELVQEIREVCQQHHIQPTFFEFTTALAFLYFARASIDIAIVEVGMGGRYDATNVIVPLVSVITNVGLDHTDYFGSTKIHVAKEKAGIIKEGAIVVTGEQDPEVLRIFSEEAKEKHARIIETKNMVGAKVVSAELDGQEVEVQAGVGSFVVHLPLLGSHQVENMKTAIAALTLTLSPSGERGTLNSNVIAVGIANTKWEGRLQVLSKQPLIIIDGAHNGDGARALAKFLEQVPHKKVLVFGSKQGKDISDMISCVVPLFSHVIITEGSFMPESADKLAERMRTLGKEVIVEKNSGKAFQKGRGLLENNDSMVITGSLYMVGDVLSYIQ